MCSDTSLLLQRRQGYNEVHKWIMRQHREARSSTRCAHLGIRSPKCKTSLKFILMPFSYPQSATADCQLLWVSYVIKHVQLQPQFSSIFVHEPASVGPSYAQSALFSPYANCPQPPCNANPKPFEVSWYSPRPVIQVPMLCTFPSHSFEFSLSLPSFAMQIFKIVILRPNHKSMELPNSYHPTSIHPTPHQPHRPSSSRSLGCSEAAEGASPKAEYASSSRPVP